MAPRGGGGHESGWRFFREDEDELGLEAPLQAMAMRAAGRAWIRARPQEAEQAGGQDRWAHSPEQLPPGARRWLVELEGQTTAAAV